MDERRYDAIYACGHTCRLQANWTPVVETPSLGPYEGYCHSCRKFVAIIRFELVGSPAVRVVKEVPEHMRRKRETAT